MDTNVKLLLQYDGTDFNGWQVQAGQSGSRTVQSVLETALGQVVKEPVKATGAGRTDAGVHARGQVANFHTCSPIPVDKWSAALNSILPRDMAVIGAEEVPGEFHARFDAVRKTYRYHILRSTLPDVFWRHFAFHVPQELDLEAMHGAAARLVGRHDFKSFCAEGSRVSNFERTVFDAELKEEGDLIILEITADGFLYKMVRMITGILLEIGRGKVAPERVDALLSSAGAEKGGPTAPPQGLVLQSVEYD